MLCTNKTYLPPQLTSQDFGEVILGHTLPSLLDEACNCTPNPQAFNQWTEAGWQSLSNQEFRRAAEAVALGFIDLNLESGDRIALLMHSNVNFCLVDMGCLLANLVDVPIDLTQTLEHIIFVLQHSEAKVLVISNLDLFTQIAPYLQDVPALKYIIVSEVPAAWDQVKSQWSVPLDRITDKISPPETHLIPSDVCLDIPTSLHPTHLAQSHATSSDPSPGTQILSLTELQQRGQKQPEERLQQLRTTLKPETLATIVYIPDETDKMQGVMLTHENLSGNAIASFSGIANLQRGNQETVLSFLPLNHVLARCLLYGHINYGHCIYFSNPNRVIKHLKEVQPTVLVTVPLFLEKIYSKILEKGNKSKPAPANQDRDDEKILSDTYISPFLLLFLSFTSRIRFSLSFLHFFQVAFTQFLFNWSLGLARHYDLARSPRGLYLLLLKLADWLVFSRWRAVFGGRLKHLICGGAALPAEIATVFAAAGIPVLHGYGLTQASAVVCCNRGTFHRAGTVGIPIAGVELAIAPDGEILVRSPYITPGYYKNPTATQALIDPQGWLHTGDLGSFTQDGFLKITGLKKALFKLSTGKYIAPQPIEARIKQSPLVTQAIVVGSERKFCAMLIAPNLDILHQHAQTIGFDLPDEQLLTHPCTIALYQSLIDAANCHLPYWGIVKRFRLINAPFTLENGLLTTTGQVNRSTVSQTFAADMDALYREEPTRRISNLATPSGDDSLPVFACPPTAVATCPAYAQSLNPRLTT